MILKDHRKKSGLNFHKNHFKIIEKSFFLVVFVLSLPLEIIAKQRIKKLKVFEILKMLGDDGWYLHDQKGSHRQFKPPTKKGKVTVNGNQVTC